MPEGPWGSEAGEEGLLPAWPSWLIWTSKPRVCSEDAGRSLPRRDRCPFDGEKKGCCTERVEEGDREKESPPHCGHVSSLWPPREWERPHSGTSSISSVQGSQPTTGVFTSLGNGRRSGGQGLITSCCCCCSFSITELCLFVTPWTVAHQASLSFIISLSLLKLTSIESVMPSNQITS